MRQVEFARFQVVGHVARQQGFVERHGAGRVGQRSPFGRFQKASRQVTAQLSVACPVLDQCLGQGTIGRALIDYAAQNLAYTALQGAEALLDDLIVGAARTAPAAFAELLGRVAQLREGRHVRRLQPDQQDVVVVPLSGPVSTGITATIDGAAKVYLSGSTSALIMRTHTPTYWLTFHLLDQNTNQVQRQVQYIVALLP